ncbi:hypothetical protein SAMN00808754_1257 [Thermanaeromonas toyohensis ToBE]|uniref:PASTA domain-containing protein n=1 Tax=Thermanaeromonas toyohensis ToBE TaxID=698762 RepID=A0A1W1VQ67_9FIRM|nr:hypothetical protein [Thermanaeromonas toyohensis]SMB95498.1 hypothetical protein SAMN00808754_1257 [Thermanaeromonas toyohensis ToBE]
MFTDCLGLPPEEACHLLNRAGYQVVATCVTGGGALTGQGITTRVVRVRVVGAGQVELVVAPVINLWPPGKGGAGAHAPSDY